MEPEISSADEVIQTTLWNPESASEAGSDHVAVDLSEFLRAPSRTGDSEGPNNPAFARQRYGIAETSTQAGPGHVSVDFRNTTAAPGDAVIKIPADATTYRPTEGFELDGESGRPIPPEANKLSAFALGEKTARAHLTDMVKTHEMSAALMDLFDRPEALALPTQVAKLETSLNALIAGAQGSGGSSVAGNSSGGDTIVQGDSPRVAGRDAGGRIEILEQPRANVNVTKLQQLQQTLATQMHTLQQQIQGARDEHGSVAEKGLAQLKEDLLMTGAREKIHEGKRLGSGLFASGDRNTLRDGIKRNVMGKEMHAVVIRSILQSALVTGGTYGVQRATSALLKNHFENNPDQIPKPVLDAARKALGGNPTREAIQERAIADLAKPGSTYLDENKTSEAMIVYLEAGLGFGRGTILPIADSKNEIDDKAKKVAASIDGAEAPKVTKTRGEKAKDAMSNAWKDQVTANMISGAVAALAQAVANSGGKAADVMLEAGKTMGFAGVTTASNVAADGIRATFDGGQAAKGALRVGFRTVAQGIKTGVSMGQSAGEGTFGSRSVPADAIRGVMQGTVGGAVKEVAGSGVQAIVNANLPANEVAMLKVGKTISAAADVLRTLNEIEETGKPLLDESVVESARAEIKIALERIYDVNSADFGSQKFNWAFQDYASNVNRTIVTRLDGAEHPEPAEDAVAGPSNPTRRDAARTQV